MQSLYPSRPSSLHPVSLPYFLLSVVSTHSLLACHLPDISSDFTTSTTGCFSLANRYWRRPTEPTVTTITVTAKSEKPTASDDDLKINPSSFILHQSAMATAAPSAVGKPVAATNGVQNGVHSPQEQPKKLANGYAIPAFTAAQVKSAQPQKYQTSSATVAGILNKVASYSRPEPVPVQIAQPLVAAQPVVNGVYNSTSSNSTSTAVVKSKVSGQEIRTAFRNAANSVWVITSAWDDQPVGFTAITVNSVSIDPPMITFNIGRNSSSLNTVSRSLRFAVHLLSQDEAATAKRFAASADKRFADATTWRWHQDGLPELTPNTLARLSGNILSLSAAGDNLLALGAVENISQRPGQPLVYHQGVYRTLQDPTTPRRDRRIYLNAFDMSCIGHQSPGLWAHPNDRASTYKDLEYWTNLAQLLEKGGFDSLFLADVLGTYDVYKGSRDAAVRASAQVPVNDPVLSIPAMAAVTKRLGFGVTVSLTYELPYSFARRMSTLDHLTKGRVAWNIVTSYLKSAATNLGLDTQIPHDERYNIAEEFMEVCYKLWEGSWEQDAVVADVKNGIYTDPAKIHDINHRGKYYNVPGAHLCEPSPQRTPYLFQAGASTKGQAFAAKHAEAVFIAGPNPSHLKKIVAGIRKSATEAGRNPYDVKIFALLTIITAETDELAHAKHEDYKQYASIEGALALYGGWAGVDLSTLDVDQPLEYVENDAIRSVNEMWSKQNGSDSVWTPRKIAEKISIGGLGPLIVGSGTSIADQLEKWVDESDVDGFNLAYAVTPGSFEDIIEHVVPELRLRGRLLPIEDDDAPRTTLRERMGYPHAKAHVGKDHPAWRYKVSK
ncbi:luciferase-like domain-containing protein [Fimicolochytrium jonesii]|uniref:luciferase-like domain-containing protein n=1 Tax=Fimicolochytrium jonesii TaxID=1396493 RepID=UPI0022FDFDCD|nr:luciferase-like domain-containing protein [Fimicolochytrium jonesii]KAI8817487.1 luciferase-like domain-containing protein [Fimicolochytrium jonesii]